MAKREGFVWIHLSRADIRCRNWVDQHAPLSEIAREIMLGDEDHQRVEVYGREIVGVIPELHLEFDNPTEDLTRLRFAMTDRLLVTMRRIPLRSVENVRRSIAAGTLYAAPIEIIDAIIDHFAHVIGKLAERIGDDLDLVEERIAHSPRGDESQLIARARSQSMRVHRQLSQMRGPVPPAGAARCRSRCRNWPRRCSRWRRRSTTSITRSPPSTIAPGCCRRNWQAAWPN